ncbi:MAG: hypothetical protein P8X82_06105 [Gemmatimonadales bacterium]|jgi:hypothetical protein
MLSRGARRRISYAAIVYFAAMAVALTFPGIRTFNTIRPFIFGVPFVFAWYLMWILGAVVVFLVLHRVYSE